MLSRFPSRTLARAAVVALAATLAACDSATPEASRVVDVGPPLAAFPQEALFTLDEIDDLLQGEEGLTQDTIVVVPLVFDENDRLYSPLGFNLALDSLLDAQAPEAETKTDDEDAMGPVYFTDMGTFREVVESAPAQKRASYASMYPGRFGPVMTLSGGERKAAEPYIQQWDPYSCMDNPDLCPEPPPYNPPPPSNPPSNPPPSGRYNHNVGTTYGTTPTWPTLWRGDIISGNGYGGNPFGHTSIVTRLSSFGNTGGNFESTQTLAMEAVKEYIFNQDKEVEERPARTYWMDETSPEDVYIRYHNEATWSERGEAISYARAQDPDAYAVFSTKLNRSRWYCSKLIWRSYKQATGDDLDHDWGIWVFPGDLEHSGHLKTVYRFRHSD